jgi:hypothetical protein
MMLSLSNLMRELSVLADEAAYPGDARIDYFNHLKELIETLRVDILREQAKCSPQNIEN